MTVNNSAATIKYVLKLRFGDLKTLMILYQFICHNDAFLKTFFQINYHKIVDTQSAWRFWGTGIMNHFTWLLIQPGCLLSVSRGEKVSDAGMHTTPKVIIRNHSSAQVELTQLNKLY